MKGLLIVEDNEQMRRMIKTVVAHLAEATYECGDGSQALGWYAAGRPDWVLMDIEMPGVDGITATRRIKEAFPEAKVMIVTDYGGERLRRAARRAGACEYVLKENLLDVLRVLSRDRHGDVEVGKA